MKESEHNDFTVESQVKLTSVILILTGFLGVYAGGVLVNNAHIFSGIWYDCQFLLVPPTVGLLFILILNNFFFGKALMSLIEIQDSKRLSLRLNLILFGLFLFLTILTLIIDLFSNYNDIHPKTPIGTLLESILLILPFLLFQVVFEEIVFRRLTYNVIKFYISNRIIVIVASGLIFSLAHSMNLEYDQYGFGYLMSIFIAGVFFQYLYIVSNSLYLSILFHFISNLISLFVLQLDTGQLNIPSLYVRSDFSVWADIIIMLLQILIFVFLFNRIKHRIDEN